MALLPDHPPARFRWRGRLWLIARAEGPERIAPEWWRHEDGQGELWLRPAATAEARGPGAAAVDAAGLDAVGLDAAGLDAVGLDAVGLDAVGLDAVGLDAVGLDAATRDYYRVETVEGRRFWLFRRGLAETRPHDAPATAPAWYLHAIAP